MAPRICSTRSSWESSCSRTITLTLRGVRADTVTRRLVCSVHRAGDGLVVEARLDGDDERATMNDIARRLAEVTDMAEVLRTLCDIATHQCSASSAAVLRVLGHQGEVVAAAGDLCLLYTSDAA